MSAIFGRVELDGRPIEPTSFTSSFDMLRLYGRDRSDFWIEGPIGLGRHLLKVAAAAELDQQATPEDGLAIVADAILDNRSELADALGVSSQLSAISDTELIRQSYRRWGEDCVQHLVGDYTFAIVRTTDRQVFLARDHIGSRPLFISQRQNTLLFSSSIESIVRCAEWRWSIDERVVAEYLINPLLPLSKPLFKGVCDVPPGSTVRITRTHHSTTQWWRPRTSATSRRDASDTVDECRHWLERGICDRVTTSGRVGAHFSGGVDSTGVAVIASRSLRAAGRTLTSGYAWSPAISAKYPTARGDERRRILALAQAETIPIRFGAADEANLQAFLHYPLEFEGEADLADEVPVARAAEEDGLRVLLSGWGGDEAFSAHAHGHLAYLVFNGKFLSAKRFAASYGQSLRRPEVFLSFLWRGVVHPLLPDPLYRQLAPYTSRPQGVFISSKLRTQHEDLVKSRRDVIKFGPNPNENLLAHLSFGHLSMRMESWAALAAPHGFQYRYPLTDRRLLEFLLSLSPEHLFLGDRPRGLARAVLADLLPATASKSDVANEALRRDTRESSWSALAQEVARGGFDEDCPWLDMSTFRERALAPASDQAQLGNILAFAELFSAARVWALYQRARANGWA